MKVGDKIKMCGERTRYTVQGFDERFVICTKPHFQTYLYTIIDKDLLIRGPINMIFGPPDDVSTPEGARDCLEFMRTEDGGHKTWGVSRRNNMHLTQKEAEQIGLGVKA